MIPIVAIIMGIGMGGFSVWVKHKKDIAKLEIEARERAGQFLEGETMASRVRVEELEDRVAVLERIITDNSVNVAAQIEALRDTTSIEELTAERSKV